MQNKIFKNKNNSITEVDSNIISKNMILFGVFLSIISIALLIYVVSYKIF